ncbi:PepSY domain-containing protein [Mesorhizobium sp. BR1-1-16]|uniref:PepSY-associated TM helix domain-containing protein n=1 Tax=Mesorhizobium sp. BR1-1-16 TaxID=2876653 RepID=UPI001CCBC17E|nr:PepSY domain-containing protein [Mesorhizobium sp. BR1-1-16]MBZ9937210.1 PepSY domain-containing protein [Mesorhizobium sp. BR1-1-16]
MSTTTFAPSAPQDAAAGIRLYRAVWRWHFYAGLFVAPFLLVLACTGLIMVYGNSVETFLGAKYYVAPGGERTSLVDQAAAAAASVPGSMVKLMVSPESPDRATVFVLSDEGVERVVSVDPHGARVVGDIVKDDTWFYWANHIHGTLLAGDFGDRLLEIAAGLGIVMILSGLYLWWPRGDRGFLRSFIPNLTAHGRGFWKEIHGALGFSISIVLLFFLISGLAWTGIWGTKIVQAWSTFPAAKFDNVPLSDKTHASMNHGAMKEVPWALEQTPMPASGSMAGMTGLPMGSPVNLDTVAAFARQIGFDGQFRVNLPHGDDGVFTISADSMDGDTHNPAGDRTVHVDRFTGKILADVRFADYSLPGKAMAVGIALHQANLGWWNTLLNLAFCLSVITMVISGVVMWWKRRPAGKVGVPLYPRDWRAPVAIIVIALAVSIVFPLTGIAIIAFAVIDFLLPKRWKEASGRTATT